MGPLQAYTFEWAQGAYLQFWNKKAGGGGINHRLSFTSNEMNRFIVPWKLINRECCHMNLVL